MRHLLSATLIATILPLTGFAAGGAGPGGGASYRNPVTGELKTLAQTGIIFERAAQLGSKVYPKYYEVKPEAIKELKGILSKLPKTDLKIENDYWAILGERDTFIDQQQVDKVEYEKIKNSYRNVIRSYGKKLDELAFVLAAYGKKDAKGFMRTYILPAFDDHNYFQQGLLLIHEYFMRQPYYSKEELKTLYGVPESEKVSVSQRLAMVLNLDVIILDILKNGQSDDSTLKFYEALYQLGGIKPERLGYFKLALLEKRLGRPLLASELVRDPEIVKHTQSLESRIDYNPGIEIDPSLVQKFEKLMPGIAQGFDHGWYLKSNYVGSYDFFYDIQVKSLQNKFDLSPFGSDERLKAEQELLTFEHNKPQLIEAVKTEHEALCQKSSVMNSRFREDFLITTDKSAGLVSFDCASSDRQYQIGLKKSLENSLGEEL